MLVIAFTHPSSELKANPSSVKTETVTVMIQPGQFPSHFVLSNHPIKSEWNGNKIMWGTANPSSLMPLFEKCWPELKGVASNKLNITTAMYKAGYILKSASMCGENPILIFEK